MSEQISLRWQLGEGEFIEIIRSAPLTQDDWDDVIDYVAIARRISEKRRAAAPTVESASGTREGGS